MCVHHQLEEIMPLATGVISCIYTSPITQCRQHYQKAFVHSTIQPQIKRTIHMCVCMCVCVCVCVCVYVYI